jgi:hypothetical protein
LCDDKNLPENEKASRLRQYSNEVRATIQKQSAPSPRVGPSGANPKDVAPSSSYVAWKRAWIEMKDLDKAVPLWGFQDIEIMADGHPRRYTDRVVLLDMLEQLDVSMDKQLSVARKKLIEHIRARPRAGKEYTFIGMYGVHGVDYIVYDDDIKLGLRNLRRGIRDGALAQGVDVEAVAR